MKIPSVPDPTPTPNLADLLDDASAFISRFMAFDSDHQLVTSTLWAAHTHLAPRVTVTPYLHATSVEPESGKSRLLEVLETIVANPWRTVMPTPAVLYRKIDQSQDDGGVTLLLDEIDPIFNKKGSDDAAEALRAVLNAGYQKGLTVERCQPPSMKVIAFNPYGPKALAGIGDVPDTIASRSIRIRLKRRKPSERVDPFFPDEVVGEAEGIREMLAEKVAQVSLADRRQIRRELLHLGLGDRAADGWSSLIAIADEAGGSWPKWGRDAARELSAKQASESDGLGIRLLQDCRDVLEGWEHEHIFSVDLRRKLTDIEDGPWSDYKGGDISARSIAWLLGSYDIPSATRRIDGETKKGYRLEDFQDAFSRYIPPLKRHTVTTPVTVEENGDSQTSHIPDVTDSKSADSLTGSRDVTDVTDESADIERDGDPDAAELILEAFNAEEIQ